MALTEEERDALLADARNEAEQLRKAARRALTWATDFHSDNQREVIEELEDALGGDGQVEADIDSILRRYSARGLTVDAILVGVTYHRTDSGEPLGNGSLLSSSGEPDLVDKLQRELTHHAQDRKERRS